MELGQVPRYGVQGNVGILEAEASALDADPGHAGLGDVEGAHTQLLPVEVGGHVLHLQPDSFLRWSQTSNYNHLRYGMRCKIRLASEISGAEQPKVRLLKREASSVNELDSAHCTVAQ